MDVFFGERNNQNQPRNRLGTISPKSRLL